MTHTWVKQAISCLEQQQDIILVTVAQVKGSAPREPGAKMIVSTDRQWLTIGGGNLEWQACVVARDHLRQSQDQQLPNRWLQTFQLGPSLGQCCGGVVGLVFESLIAADLVWLRQLDDGLSQSKFMSRKLPVSTPHSDAFYSAPDHVVIAERHPSKIPLKQDYDFWQNGTDGHFFEIIQPSLLNVLVFGAGHVGKALIHILGTLPFNITWVDSRSELFTDYVPDNVQIEDTDIPDEIIRLAPPASCFIIMTHDHALDQKLCEQVLQRDDYLFFGLIGSQTKKKKFEHRFQAKGINPEQYTKMVCPVGDPNIRGKQPAVIALAIASQLIQLSDNQGG